jgi:diguanylate cyclase (GGDEF)-like protein
MNEAYEKMDGVLERNFENSDYCTGKQRSKYKDGFAYCMPLKAGEQFLGVLNLNGNSQGFFDRKEFHFVALIAEILSASISNVKQLEIQKKLAVTDGLTGLLNHRSFQERLNMEYDRASRFKNPLSCVMVDIDFFKKINDTHGHPIGDAILRELAARLKKYLRKVDTVARYGGEEFAMLLPQTDAWAAHVVAERIRADVEALAFETSAGPINVTISLGISDTNADGVSTYEELLKKSDEGLYRAKSEGRNRTVVNEG